MTGQMDMFGGPDIPAPRQPVDPGNRPVTQDMDLIIAVVKVATDPGYVLIGSSFRAYRRVIGQEVEDASERENGAIHQLIEQNLLEVGGGHNVTYQGYSGRANSVLVTRKITQLVSRWEALKRLPSDGPQRHTELTEMRGKRSTRTA